MKHSLLPTLFFLMTLFGARAETDPDAQRLNPDTIIMNDGKELHGLIIKNDALKVVLQQRMGELEILKKYIRRIEDQGETGVYFATIINPGKLPPWRMVVQDLRTDDNIRSFNQIPATAINEGYLKNIPYLSFRINQHTEMNVYGNPEDPVCLEFGVYEHGKAITQFKKLIRAYLAGCLSSRAEIGALYSLDEKGGECQAGQLRFKILPPTSPGAYGGWWISAYLPKRLDSARLGDAAYEKVTLPFDQVNNSSGHLRDDLMAKHHHFLSQQEMDWSGVVPGYCGFKRDKDGQLIFLPCVPKIKKPSSTLPSTQ